MPSSDAVTEENPAICCAQFYENDVVQQLLGDSFHPGGKALSERLVYRLNLPPSSKVLDVACGVGTTTRMMASKFGLHATGLDFSEVNVSKATSMVAAETEKTNSTLNVIDEGSCCGGGQDCGSANFVAGSADQLPFDDATFDAVVCECAVSTFGDQAKVASEFARVLKPGGVLGMTDMVVNGELPTEVAANIAPWTCMSKALTVPGYQRLFLDHGFSVTQYVDESEGLNGLISELKRKLVMAGIGNALGALATLNLDLKQMRSLLGQAKSLVADGSVQYGLIVFSKGKPSFPLPLDQMQSSASCC